MHKDQFDALGARILLVGMGTIDQTAAFLRRQAVPFPMACDPQRSLYRIFSLKRTSPLAFLSPVLAAKGLSAISKGHAVGVPQGDIRQLAGVFIIDGQGAIVYQHESRNPADHPDTAVLISFLRNMQNAAR